jgi:serine/threonine protein kinase
MSSGEHGGSDAHGEALPPGTLLLEFEIQRVLGQGGFGITYLAKDTKLGREVVIKENLPVDFAFRDTSTRRVMPRSSSGGDSSDFEWALKNFEREAETLASLNHPGIVPVLRSFEANGTAYFTMPFIGGTAFEEQVSNRQKSGRRFTEEELGGFLWRMLNSLEHLHERSIYHRDINPRNILISPDGEPILIDFGAARQQLGERSMTVLESPGYTPFEQLQSRGAMGPWVDLYALGGTLYKAITGRTPMKSADRILEDFMEPLAARSDLQALYGIRLLRGIDRAMAVKVKDRFQSAGEWREAIWGNGKGGRSSTDIEVSRIQAAALEGGWRDGEEGYYTAVNGARSGPYRVDTIQKMVAEGSLSKSDHCWRGGMDQWVTIGEMIGNRGASAGRKPPAIPRNPGRVDGSIPIEDDLGGRILFFSVPKSRLVLMSIFSLGVYQIYWMYRNWKHIQVREGLDISPFGRALLGVFYICPLLSKIKEEPVVGEFLKKGSVTGYVAQDLAVGWIVMSIVGAFLSFGPVPIAWGFLGIGIWFASVLCLLPAQGLINAVNFIRAGGRPVSHPWSLGQFLCLLGVPAAVIAAMLLGIFVESFLGYY